MRTSAIITGIAAGLLLSMPAEAQRISRVGLRGQIASASAEVLPDSDTVVYTTPARPFFVLTEVCFDGGGMQLSGATFGAIPRDVGMCTTYHPGIAMPPNEPLSCDNPNGIAANCMITGVLTR